MKTLKEKVIDVVNEEVNPVIASHNGACEVVDVVDRVVSIRLTGGCAGCMGKKMTMKQGIEPLLQEKFGENINVELVD